jgi:hypothetical protein
MRVRYIIGVFKAGELIHEIDSRVLDYPDHRFIEAFYEFMLRAVTPSLPELPPGYYVAWDKRGLNHGKEA